MNSAHVVPVDLRDFMGRTSRRTAWVGRPRDVAPEVRAPVVRLGEHGAEQPLAVGARLGERGGGAAGRRCGLAACLGLRGCRLRRRVEADGGEVVDRRGGALVPTSVRVPLSSVSGARWVGVGSLRLPLARGAHQPVAVDGLTRPRERCGRCAYGRIPERVGPAACSAGTNARCEHRVGGVEALGRCSTGECPLAR